MIPRLSVMWSYPLVGLLAFGLLGCGGAENRLKTVSAAGTIQLDGQPFGPGQIELMPEKADAETSRMAVGQVDASGEFKLGSYEAADGAVPGTYAVRLIRGSGEDAMPGVEVTIDYLTVTVPPEGNSSLSISATEKKSGQPGGLLSPKLDVGGAPTTL